MYKGGSKFLPVIIVVIVIIVAIIAVVALGRAFLNRNDQSEPVDDRASRALMTTDADHSVRMTVRGPIVANENFNSYQIEISPIERRMTTYEGYQKQVIEDIRLANNTAAYREFVSALNRFGFTNEEEVPGEQEDLNGICSSGRLYTFDILQAQSTIKQLWTSSCRGATGTFGGEAVETKELFLEQIPENADLIRDLNMQ